jgi:hypothetical protein
MERFKNANRGLSQRLATCSARNATCCGHSRSIMPNATAPAMVSLLAIAPASDCGGLMGALDRFTGRQAALDMHERQRDIVDHHRPPTLDACWSI